MNEDVLLQIHAIKSMQFSFKKLLLFAGLLLVLFVGWFAWQLIGPGPQIVVAKETTYITAPLRANGLPDYERHLLEKYREDVTPENNAAVLFWQAMGPGDMSPADFEAVAQEIGLERFPLPEDCLEEADDEENAARIKVWLEQEGRIRTAIDDEFSPELEVSEEPNPETIVYELLDQFLRRPWTSEQIPPLAEWVAANEKPIGLIVAATARPLFYLPSPELLNGTPDSLITMSLLSIQQTREAARALQARAMWHIGEGRLEQAWDDIFAMYRLSRLIGQESMLVEQLVSIAIEGIAGSATLTLLDAPSISPDLARRIREDLLTLETRKLISVSLDQSERIMGLSAVMDLRSGNPLSAGGGLHKLATTAAFDWNIPLRNLNQSYDDLSAAAKLPIWSDRQKAMRDFENHLKQATGSMSPGRAISGFLSRRVRSQLMSDVLVSLLLPALSAACDAEDRGNTYLTLTQLAAAIAIYRALHGDYPDSLESLVPDILDKLPVDLFHNKPYIYRRTANGYLLYCVGPNGQDDGGSSQLMHSFKGYSTDLETYAQLPELLGDELPMVEDETAEPTADGPVMRPFGENDDLELHIPHDADDFSIRLPLPKLELPKRLQQGETPQPTTP